uniref:Bifunctional enoyl-CoA hydratase/phosphate acetyltransferase n=1 Tax=candidate division WOR-3 bacterium TaxID=2052148 RepID=A0A7C3J5C7_UNCW3
MRFDDIVVKAKENRKVLSVACADDDTVIKACYDAYRENLCTPIFVGDKEKIEQIIEKNGLEKGLFEIVDEKDRVLACEKAVKIVRDEKADFLMKGFVDTSVLGKAVLNKEWGLRTGNILSHVSLFEIDRYHKPFILTDSGFIIKPDLNMKVNIIQNAVTVMKKLGVNNPKVSILAAIEKVNPDMVETVDAQNLKKMNMEGKIKDCIVDGPLSFDVTVSKESAKHKKVESEVAGDADIMVVPDIACGNIMAKTMIYWTNCKFAGVIVGAKAPVVLISRSDNEKNKMMSIAFAASIGKF